MDRDDDASDEEEGKSYPMGHGRKWSRGAEWTTEEEAYLAEWFGKMPLDDLCRALGRSANSVNGRAHLRGLTHRTKRWTEDEDLYIVNAVRYATYRQIGRAIERTESAVVIRAYMLGVTRRHTHGESQSGEEGGDEQ